jgi:hypothetical protein
MLQNGSYFYFHIVSFWYNGRRFQHLLTLFFAPSARGDHVTTFPTILPPPRLQVNRGTCRFGRYKNPRRPHPPPRASRVSHHPPQMSGLTLAHPCSPTLTRPRPPPSARPIDSGCAGPFLAPGQRGRNGLPRRCRFWVATHKMVD